VGVFCFCTDDGNVFVVGVCIKGIRVVAVSCR
jgi:hypothetical protein